MSWKTMLKKKQFAVLYQSNANSLLKIHHQKYGIITLMGSRSHLFTLRLPIFSLFLKYLHKLIVHNFISFRIILLMWFFHLYIKFLDYYLLSFLAHLADTIMLQLNTGMAKRHVRIKTRRSLVNLIVLLRILMTFHEKSLIITY